MLNTEDCSTNHDPEWQVPDARNQGRRQRLSSPPSCDLAPPKAPVRPLASRQNSFSLTPLPVVAATGKRATAALRAALRTVAKQTHCTEAGGEEGKRNGGEEGSRHGSAGAPTYRCRNRCRNGR